jgi:Family of unknown function (DUF6279)
MRWKGIIVLLLPLIVGCSALRLTYNQGPFLAYWWLDGYADFNSEQSPKVKAALDDWFTWHRATQLPEYAQALAELQGMAADNVTAGQICQQFQTWQQRAERAFDQALPAMAEQVRQLTPEQVKRIERQQTKKLAEAEADYLQDDPAERQKASFKRTLDRAESLYGKLTPGQVQLLRQGLDQSPFKPEVWLAERRQRQADSLRQLRHWAADKPDLTSVQAGLRQLGAATFQSPRPVYQAYADTLAQANCALGAAVHNASSAAQRRRAIEKLKGWEDDLRALAKR